MKTVRCYCSCLASYNEVNKLKLNRTRVSVGCFFLASGFEKQILYQIDCTVYDVFFINNILSISFDFFSIVSFLVAINNIPNYHILSMF